MSDQGESKQAWPGWPSGQRRPALAKDWPPEAIEAEGPGPWLDWLALQALGEIWHTENESPEDYYWSVCGVPIGDGFASMKPWEDKPEYIPECLTISSGLGPAGRALEALLAKGYSFTIDCSKNDTQCEIFEKWNSLPVALAFSQDTPAVAVARALAKLAGARQRGEAT